MGKTCIVIPAYNEAKRIGLVLNSLIDQGFEIIVVDDGSSDDTNDVIKKLPVISTSHILNRGQGAALKTGSELAKKLGYKYIVHFDADGQHRIEDLKKIIEMLETTENNVVIGSRFLGLKSEMPKSKQFIYFFAKIFSQNILNLNFTDPQNGLRGMSVDAFSKLNWQKDNYEHCTEILTLISKNKLKYKEIPVKINYDKYSTTKQVSPSLSIGIKLLINKLLD